MTKITLTPEEQLEIKLVWNQMKRELEDIPDEELRRIDIETGLSMRSEIEERYEDDLKKITGHTYNLNSLFNTAAGGATLITKTASFFKAKGDDLNVLYKNKDFILWG